MNAKHYDKKYFEWQRTVGEFGGKANLFKFLEYINLGDVVMDFGCGGGYLLSNLSKCSKRIGVEINDNARKEAEQKGIECFASLEDVPDNSVNTIISNHALEHVDNPVYYVEQFKRVLKSNGKVVICVPHEVGKKLYKDDIHMHLYTWSPQNLHNLFKIAGFEMIICKRLTHAWMEHYLLVQKIFGWRIFNLWCRINGFLNKKYQTIYVGINNK